MQIMKFILALLVASFALSAGAQTPQAKGKASVTYAGKLATPDVKNKALADAQIKALEFYYAEAGESESSNFDSVREKVLANPDRYFLETTILAEDDNVPSQRYTVAVRVTLNLANLRNAVKANSAVGRAMKADRSKLAFLFVSRQVDSTKEFEVRAYSRVDESAHGSGKVTTSEQGKEGESIRRGEVSTNAAMAKQADVRVNVSSTRESGGSKTQRAAESTWRLFPSANLNSFFMSRFAQSGFKVYEAGVVEPLAGGHFTVATVEGDYKTGNDLKAGTMNAVFAGMRVAQIQYVALGSLDVGMPGKDPVSGLTRVAVTVNAKVYDIRDPIPESVAAVGAVQYSGIGPSEDEARTNALKLAATNAAQDLSSQLTSQGVR